MSSRSTKLRANKAAKGAKAAAEIRAAWVPAVIEQWPVAKLKPWENNPRLHPQEQIELLANRYATAGFTKPMFVRHDGRVISGHGRLEAARLSGLKSVPVIVAPKEWTDEQCEAELIADNQLGDQSKWDDGKLGAKLQKLVEAGFDLKPLGFSDSQLKSLAPMRPGAEQGDPESVPEAPAVPVSRPGDIWQLGEHRLICGDSTSAEVIAKLLAGAKPHLMVTDPPYGVEYDPAWRNEALRADGSAVGARATGQVLNDDKADWREVWELFPGDVAYVWHAGLFAGVVAESLEAAGFELRSQIIWGKSNFAIGRGHYHWKHEPCWYAVREKGTGHWNGARDQHTLWEIAKPAKSETGHGTQKPIECMLQPMLNNSVEGDAVFEPFSGSGTTIIAGETCGRVVLACELNPVYVDVAVRRWIEFTKGAKGEARLAGDGRAFDDVAAERLPKAA